MSIFKTPLAPCNTFIDFKKCSSKVPIEQGRHPSMYGLTVCFGRTQGAFLGRLHWDALRRAVSSDLCHHPTSGHCQQPGILLRQVRQLSCKLHKNVSFNMTKVAQTTATELVGHVFSQQKTNLVSTYRKWKILVLRHHHHNPPATIFLVVSPTASGYKF